MEIRNQSCRNKSKKKKRLFKKIKELIFIALPQPLFFFFLPPIYISTKFHLDKFIIQGRIYECEVMC